MHQCPEDSHLNPPNVQVIKYLQSQPLGLAQLQLPCFARDSHLSADFVSLVTSLSTLIPPASRQVCCVRYRHMTSPWFMLQSLCRPASYPEFTQAFHARYQLHRITKFAITAAITCNSIQLLIQNPIFLHQGSDLIKIKPSTLISV